MPSKAKTHGPNHFPSCEADASRKGLGGGAIGGEGGGVESTKAAPAGLPLVAAAASAGASKSPE